MQLRPSAILAILVFLFAAPSFSQVKEFQSKNKKALKNFTEGKKHYEKKEDDKAIGFLEKSISADPQFIDPHILLGAIYYDRKDFSSAVDYFKKAIAINPKYSSTNYYSLGSAYLKQGKYAEALPAYKALLTFGRLHPDLEKLARRDLANCEFGANALKNPVNFNPINLGPNINTEEYEYFPALTADEQTLLFTRNTRASIYDIATGSQEDFFISYKVDGNWEPSQNMGPPINTPRNEGAPTLSADGQILVFTACEDRSGDYGSGREGYGRCDLFFSKKVGNNWSRPQNLGAPVNSPSWESQPSFAADGKALYFISDRKGGLGDADIWMSELGDNGRWGNPVNLGPNINSPGKEESIFIHPDNQTLYFASNGHVGMGGVDIYMSRKDADGNWGPAQNLG
ncbi:MAG: PD40 domain-containing protein, partial [Bacteroidetes bacterium]|nr:PD40 domain-containing protein [Bacteroidota bacterium]